jgi:hypothetical protein
MAQQKKKKKWNIIAFSFFLTYRTTMSILTYVLINNKKDLYSQKKDLHYPNAILLLDRNFLCIGFEKISSTLLIKL